MIYRDALFWLSLEKGNAGAVKLFQALELRTWSDSSFHKMAMKHKIIVSKGNLSDFSHMKDWC